MGDRTQVPGQVQPQAWEWVLLLVLESALG